MANWNPDTAAKRGATFLDKHYPGWFRKVKVTNLHMEDPNMCVIGYCFGEFWGGLDQIREKIKRNTRRDVWSVNHGFNTPEGDSTNGDYERLGLAWLPLIRERRAKARKKVK